MRALYLILACSVAWGGPQKPGPRRSGTRQLHVPVAMRDRVHLYANLFLPTGGGRVPTILIRTPYGKGSDLNANWQAFVDRGYAVLIQDVRGRYESEGSFDPLRQEPNDGDDTINWIARQPWSNGSVGMTGGSYVGIVQWKAALLNNPHLKAIFPVVSGYDDYRDRFYSTGGAMKLGQRLEWMAENLKAPGYHPDFDRYTRHLPLRTCDVVATGWSSEMYHDVMAHPTFDSFWRGISVKEQLAKIRIPVFAVGGWYDNYVQSDLEAFATLRKTIGLNRVVVGPWPHNMSIPFDGVDFGSDSAVPVRELQLEWFDQWLMGKDTPMMSAPPVHIFVMGANRWLDDRAWPPEHARAQSFYLAADGSLDSHPPRQSAQDHYVYDPNSPAPTRGGAVCCNPKVFPWGPMDQRAVEQRADVLVYTTDPLKHDLEAVGPVKAVLYVATSAPDTDFTAKLVDVFPDGAARNLCDGLLRLRYRNSLEKPELAQEGTVYQIAVDAGVTANVFLKGHRIRLEISSSNFPRFDRNPNTGGMAADETRLLKATQTIYRDSEHPSHLELMVVQ
ncbi:X-Pro dipeptidyl-peptidase C-terminal domain protein [Candidatus Sulfopaludibacter sp. SbA3]|nr:X-Pro dipeptidyl-peptidase C-terminal domain protein [Candidatus Sulfopaludibacter sp. SbA3]